MVAPPDFVDALITAPVGVALLAVLEGAARHEALPWELLADSDAAAVRAAADTVAGLSFGSLVATAVEPAALRIGPWMPDAPDNLARAYRDAERRRPIAQAIDERFGAALHAPLDPAAQQWWHSGSPDNAWFTRPRFEALDEVYGAGQFTVAGMWTVSDPPPEVHAPLAGAWEIDHEPISRWQLPVRAHARVFEIDRPADWVRLVSTYPATGRPHPEWELPGPNQDPGALTPLLAVRGQHGARTSIRRHLVPDWAAVAADYDGVHLSWAGYLTTEGYVSDLADGDVAMLRYWFSERSHWLRDVFGDPVPLEAPDRGPDGQLRVVDVRHDAVRRHQDRVILDAQRGLGDHREGSPPWP